MLDKEQRRAEHEKQKETACMEATPVETASETSEDQTREFFKDSEDVKAKKYSCSSV